MFSLIGAWLADVFTDTLTVDGKWSRMNLIMFTSWMFVIISASLYFIFSGFHFEVWIVFVTVAVTGKLVNAKAKKMER